VAIAFLADVAVDMRLFCVFSSGDLDVTIALQLSEYLVNETEYVPWRIGLEGLRYIGGLLETHPDYMYFKVNIVLSLEILTSFRLHHNTLSY